MIFSPKIQLFVGRVSKHLNGPRERPADLRYIDNEQLQSQIAAAPRGLQYGAAP